MKNEVQMNPGSNRILRLREVCHVTGLSRTGVYERMRNGGFPPSVSLGGRCVGWNLSEVIDWINSRSRKN